MIHSVKHTNERRVHDLHRSPFSLLLLPLSSASYSFRALIFHLTASPSVRLHVKNREPLSPPLAVARVLVLISTQDSRGVAFTLAINPFPPVSAYLPIGYSLGRRPVSETSGSG